ncbi:hypothetical protein Tco_0604680 [Tanacetum coccineum]
MEVSMGKRGDDSSKEDEVLDEALGGLGDCGVVIGDGGLAMGDFDGEVIGKFGGDGVTNSTKFRCLTLILGFLLSAFVEEELEDTIVG